MEDSNPKTLPRSPSILTPSVGISTTSIDIPTPLAEVTPLPITEEDLNAPPPTPNLDPTTYL